MRQKKWIEWLSKLYEISKKEAKELYYLQMYFYKWIGVKGSP